MNKKKYIIAIVLFIFVGLTVFTFANPRQKEDIKGDKTNNDVVDKNDNANNDDLNNNTNDGNTNDNNDNNNNNILPVINNNVNNQIQNNDNSYEKALAAVIDAEEKVNDESYNTALDLVNRVTRDNKKQELQTRLDEVKDGITARKLVNVLAESVNSATDKDNMDAARDFRKDNEIIDRVSKVSNQTVKKELENKLDELAKLLDDTEAPVVNITDGAVLASEVEIQINDENEFTMKLTKDGQPIEVENNKVVEEGVYTLNVLDKAFNEVNVKFTVDLTAPKFNVTSGTHSTTNIEVKIDELTLDYVEVYKQDDKTTKKLNTNEFTLEEEGTYRLTAYDKAGHKTEVWVAIDKTAPVITGVENGKYYKKNVKVTVEDKFLVKVLVNDVEQTGIVTTGTNNEGRTLVKEFTEEGVYTIVATDKVGNSTTVTFTIDKTKPVISGVENNKYYNTDVTPIIDDINLKNATLKLNGKHDKSYRPGDTLTKEGTYTLVATDLAMNKTSLITFTIDKTAPSATVSYSTEVRTNGNIVVTISASEKILAVEGWTLAEDGMTLTREFEANTTGNVKIVDLAGNEATVDYAVTNIDKDAPVVTLYNDKGNVVSDGVFSIKNIKAVIEDYSTFTAVLKNQNGVETDYVSGTMITTRGNYTLTVTDEASNVTVVTFAIDKDYPLVYLNGVKYEKVVNDIKYFTKGDVELNVKELNLDKIILTKNDEEITYTDNMVITEEGIYNIVVTDKANHKTSVKFVIDRTAPSFRPEKWGYTLEADKNANFVCPDMTSYVTDNVSGVDKVVLDEWYAKNWSIPDQTKVGEFVCRYFSYDKAGNRVSNDIFYKVVDTTKPVITLNGERTINLVGGVDSYTEEFATVTDNVDADVTDLAPAYINYYTLDGVFLGRVDSVNTNSEGRYNLVYYTKDAAGNEADKVTRIVYVRFEEETNKIFVQTANDLVALADGIAADVANGTRNYTNKEIVLTNNIDLKGINWTPINAWSGVLNGTIIDGNGHTIKNMTVTGDNLREGGFIGKNASSVTIKNLVFDNAYVKTINASQTYAGVLMAKNYSKSVFENIVVKNSKVENNWQCGGIVGFAEGGSGGTDQTFNSCKVENTFVGGTNSTAGTLFGLGTVSVAVNDCTATNVNLYTDGLTWSSTQKQYNNFWVGSLYGRTLTVTNSTETNVVVVDKVM